MLNFAKNSYTIVNRYSRYGHHAFNIDDRLAAEPGDVLQHWAANDAVLLREDALHGEYSLSQNHERGLPFGADPLRATPHQHVLVLQRLSQLADLGPDPGAGSDLRLEVQKRNVAVIVGERILHRKRLNAGGHGGFLAAL